MSTGSKGEVDDIEEEIATAGPLTRFATKIVKALWLLWRQRRKEG